MSAATTAMPIPRLPGEGAPNVIFWLCAWMGAVAEKEAFGKHSFSAPILKARNGSIALGNAYVVAQIALREQEKSALDNLIHFGGLLFAWVGTTAHKGGAV